MDKCLNCKKELIHEKGRRKKMYCNDICRATFHQNKNKGKEPKYVRYSTFKELQDKLEVLMANKGQGEPEKEKEVIDSQKEKKGNSSPETMSDGLTWQQQLEWKRNH